MVFKKLGNEKYVWNYYLSHTLTFFFTTYVVSNFYSQENLAHWLIYTALLALIQLVDFGVSPILMRFIVYVTKGAKNVDDLSNFSESKELINKDFYYSVNQCSALIQLISFGILYFLYVFIGSKLILPIFNEDIFLYYIVLYLMPIYCLTRRIQVKLYALGELPKVYFQNSIITLLNFLILLGVFLSNVDFKIFIFFTQILPITIFIKNFYMLRKKEESLDLKYNLFSDWRSMDYQLLKKYFNLSSRGFIHMVLSFGWINSLPLLLANKMPIQQYIALFLTIRFFNYIDMFANSRFLANEPKLIELRKSEEENILYYESLRHLRVIISILLIGIVMLCLGNLILPYIGFKSFVLLDFPEILFLILYYILQRHYGMHAHVLSTLNIEPFYKYSIITISVSLVLLYTFQPLSSLKVVAIILFSFMIFQSWYPVKKNLESLNVSPTIYIKNFFFK